MSDLVTGEAVVLELRLAKLATRGLAMAIDVTLQFVVLFFGLLIVGGLAFVDPVLGVAMVLVMIVSVTVGYPVTMETLTRGRTLGKLALGLRVVRDDGGPIRFRHAFVRGLLGLVEIWASLFSLALIASLASKRGKRLGDLLAGTVVVHDRVPLQATGVALMPPPLAGWAAGLDLSRVPDDLALGARQYLSRMSELSPEIQAQMGARLANAVVAVISPPPPPDVPAWALLAAVVAERRRREMLRLGWRPGPPPPQVPRVHALPGIATHSAAPGNLPAAPNVGPPEPISPRATGSASQDPAAGDRQPQGFAPPS